MLDMSLTVSTKHSAEELAALIERGARNSFPNNHKEFNMLRFAEEAALYSPGRTRWQHIFRSPPAPTA